MVIREEKRREELIVLSLLLEEVLVTRLWSAEQISTRSRPPDDHLTTEKPAPHPSALVDGRSRKPPEIPPDRSGGLAETVVTHSDSYDCSRRVHTAGQRCQTASAEASLHRLIRSS